jgi:hypothetical protein
MSGCPQSLKSLPFFLSVDTYAMLPAECVPPIQKFHTLNNKFPFFSTAQPKAILVWSLRCLTSPQPQTYQNLTFTSNVAKHSLSMLWQGHLPFHKSAPFAITVFMAGN